MQQKIAALEKQLEGEKLRTEAFNTMIDIVEKDLNISIISYMRSQPPGANIKQTLVLEGQAL